MAAREFRQAVKSALAQRHYEDVVDGVKATVITELRALDSRAEIHATSYFNHSYMPDLVVSWDDRGVHRREYFLRLSTSQATLAEEIPRLDDRHPAFVGLLDDPSEADVPEDTKSALERHPSVLLAAGSAIGELKPAAESPTLASLLAPALVRGGRGLVTSNAADNLAQAATSGFDGVVQLNHAAAWASVQAFRTFLQESYASEMERSYALVWVGSGGKPDEFPGVIETASSLAVGRLRSILEYFFRSPAIGDPAFWKRIAGWVTDDDLLSFPHVPPNPNLRSLMEAKRADLLAVSVAAEQTLESGPTEPEWSLLDGALRLHLRSATLDFVRDGRKHNRLPAIHDAISLETLTKRAEGLTLDSIEIDSMTLAVSFGVKGEHSVTDDEWFSNLSQAEGFNRVNNVMVRLAGGGKLRCDLRRKVATMEHSRLRPLPDIGAVAARLLLALPADRRDELEAALGVAPSEARPLSTMERTEGED